MKNEVSIIITEDNDGHARLIEKNLRRSGLVNPIVHFRDGQEILDFLFKHGPGPHRSSGQSYLLLLDIRLPKLDGIEVLHQIKQTPELRKLPVIMLTTTDDPREIDRCHQEGCSHYIIKPLEYEEFMAAIRQLGLFLSIVETPYINGYS